MHKVIISATFSADPIQKSMYFWARSLGLDLDLVFTPYNQVFQQLLSTKACLPQNVRGTNLILICLEDFVCTRRGTDSQETVRSLRQLNPDSSGGMPGLTKTVQDLIAALKAAATQMPVPHLVIFCPPVCHRIETSKHESFASVFREEEQRIVEEAHDIDNLNFITTTELQQFYPVKDYYDPYADQTAHVPYTDEFFTALGTIAMRKLVSLEHPPYKVIVLDCDHTLWRGVCGEDGPEHILIEEPYYGLQMFMREQYQAGILLCLCSKNQEIDVLDVFAKRPDMPLTLEHMVSWRINWQSKSENIKALAQELSLSLESFIFVDDSPIECAEVRANCPEVLTLQLPTDIRKIPIFLQHVWAFDQREVTPEDAKRTIQYQQNIKRTQVREHTDSLENFLAALQLNIVISPMEISQQVRVSQLTQRTNQFNFTTQRRTVGEIQQWAQQTGQHALVVKVSDRFGDYGLVGAILYQVSTKHLEVETFLLSCRALGRSVEHRMLKQLGEIAQHHGLKTVQVLFRSTSKNQPAFDFLCSIARAMDEHLPSQLEVLNREGEARFTFSVDTLQELSTLLAADAGEDYQDNSSPISPTKESHAVEDVVHPIQSLPNLSKVMEWISEELYSAKKIQQCIASRKTPRPALQQVYVGARTKTERLLRSIWMEVLNIEEVGVNDNLAELGGGSLHVIQIHSRMAKVLSSSESPIPSISVAMLFQYPTIRTLAEFLDRGHMVQQTFAHSVQSRVALQQAAFSRQRDSKRIFETHEPKLPSR